jgi:hypothetical protein
MKRAKNKYYKEGVKAWEDGVKWQDNPYPHGSKEWESWNNGRSDTSDKAMEKFIETSILNKITFVAINKDNPKERYSVKAKSMTEAVKKLAKKAGLKDWSVR